jgi:hypothetical protein
LNAEDAKVMQKAQKKQPKRENYCCVDRKLIRKAFFVFLFCVFCASFAPSAFKNVFCLYFAAATVTKAGRKVRSAIVKPFCKTATIVLASWLEPSGAGTTLIA